MRESNTGQLGFSFLRKRKLTVDFGGGEITSDSGLLLVSRPLNHWDSWKTYQTLGADKQNSFVDPYEEQIKNLRAKKCGCRVFRSKNFLQGITTNYI